LGRKVLSHVFLLGRTLPSSRLLLGVRRFETDVSGLSISFSRIKMSKKLDSVTLEDMTDR
jgi:hypothetical protein